MPLFFAHRLTDLMPLAMVFMGFVGFCMAASVVYVVNDIADRKKDAAHPVKRARPIAEGTVSIHEAVVFCLLLLAMTGLFCLLVFRLEYCLVVGLYIVLNLLYSFKLQKIPGINAVSVAMGFVLRVFAGAAIIDVPVSCWLAGLTFLLALFLSVSKRRCEIMGGVATHDKHLFSGLAVYLLALACLAGYLAYTLWPAVIREHNAPYLYLTFVWVAPGLFRYLRIKPKPVDDCSPVSVLLRDRPLQIFVLLWIITLWWVIYMPGN